MAGLPSCSHFLRREIGHHRHFGNQEFHREGRSVYWTGSHKLPGWQQDMGLDESFELYASHCPTLQLAAAADERVGRTVMLEIKLGHAFEFANDTLRKSLTQLNAPLVEGVDVPERSLGKDAVLVKRNQFPERLRRQPLGEDRVG